MEKLTDKEIEEKWKELGVRHITTRCVTLV